MKILHISDLHVHKHEEKNEGIVGRLDYIFRHFPDHLIVVTGDIVDSGTREQYERAYQLLFPFAGRILVCPGNHSEGIKGNFYDKECAQMFDEFLSLPLKQAGTYYGYNSPCVSEIENVRFIGLDSNIETNSFLRFAQGVIGGKQLRLLAPLLDTEKVRIVYLHHHPFITANDITMRLKDAKKFEQAVTGKVDVLLFGHLHEPGIWHGKWDINWILAADKFDATEKVREITIDGTEITTQEVRVI
jgi:3',5'-cyclic AMP phosphodiesterase CpdA